MESYALAWISEYMRPLSSCNSFDFWDQRAGHRNKLWQVVTHPFSVVCSFIVINCNYPLSGGHLQSLFLWAFVEMNRLWGERCSNSTDRNGKKMIKTERNFCGVDLTLLLLKVKRQLIYLNEGQSKAAESQGCSGVGGQVYKTHTRDWDASWISHVQLLAVTAGSVLAKQR